MAAAYAALVSLMNVITRYQHPTCPVSFDKLQMRTLLDRLIPLVEFLEKYPQTRSKVRGVERKMTIAAYASRDMIESFYVNQVLAREGRDLPRTDQFLLCPNLDKAIQEMDLIIEAAAMEVKEKEPEETSSIGSFLPRLAPDFNQKGLETEAAYSALVSLMNVLTGFQHPTCPASFDKLQMETLSDKVRLLFEFLENYSPTKSNLMKDVERRILGAAYAAEHIIDSCYANQVLGNDRVDLYSQFLSHSDLQTAIQEMDIIIKEAMEVENGIFLSLSNQSTNNASLLQSSDDESGSKKPRLMPQSSHQEEHGSLLKDPLALTLYPLRVSRLPDLNEIADTNMSVCVGSSSPPRYKNVMVGFDEQFSRLMGRLTINKPSQEIIPIVGMGGIGKTTLARNVCDCPYIMRRFEIRAWVTISQDYTFADIIVPLLHDIGIREVSQVSNEELGDQLYKGLLGRKYLITLDDIWSSRAWEEIRRFIPNNYNGSRILLTTRLSKVALSIGSCSPFKMKLLDDAKSYELLSNTIFSEEVAPSELETLGKTMAQSCKGLPLSIVVLGGLLKMSPKTLEYWANVAKKVTSIINTRDDGHCMKIFSLSYDHLPVHLKPCFLYMATFKEDHKIIVSKLLELWVSNGFIKKIKDRILEEVALEYLNDLIDRNLIMAGKQGLIGKLKICIIHDSSREFCLREAKNEKFHCLIMKDTLNPVQRLESERRLSYHCLNVNYHCSSTYWNARSLVCNGLNGELFVSGSKLLLVWDLGWFIDTPQLINLRYLEFCGKLPSSISLLWNLEIVIFYDYQFICETIRRFEFWKLPNLRHLKFDWYEKDPLPDPTSTQIVCVLDSLQTLSGIENFNCTDEVFKIIPNLKALSTSCNLDYGSKDLKQLSCSFTNLARLRKLEKLHIYFFKTVLNKCFVNEPQIITFSPNLRELELCESYIPWKNMTNIGTLPNLVVLKLFDGAFYGNEWSSEEGEFQLLKVLLIDSCDLRIWRAENSHFPRLEHLILMNLPLEKIPSGIGEVPSLEFIKLETDKISIVISAKEILDQRQDEGNDDLLVKCLYYERSEEERTEVEKLSNNKFQVTFKDDYEDLEDLENYSLPTGVEGLMSLGLRTLSCSAW